MRWFDPERSGSQPDENVRGRSGSHSEYTALGVPQALRLAAIRSLGTISTGQTNVNLQRILDRLQELSRESFFLTQVSVTIALGQMETPKAIGILQSLADQTPDGRVRRIAEEAVQKSRKM